MSLPAGTRLGPFEITDQIGTGGMGVVYQAFDTNLKRDVAIKTLPESLASDADRLARFQREAEVLASLNQPNIGQIYGLEKFDDTIALVMELVEGPTLAERIQLGPLTPDETLNVAMQIAAALEAAHERGIVHRDLKPANIKLKPDGTVKVLDFGIAKALDTRALSGPNAPALTTPAMTAAGTVMGTAAYMSPEQARGKAVDQRADIWSFGCLLYEMLTGQHTFGGEDVTMVLARVLERGADMSALPGTISPAVKHTIELCLEKDPRQRIADIRDVRLALLGKFANPPAANAERVDRSLPAWRRPVVVGIFALVLGAVVATLAARTIRPAPNQAVLRSSISLSFDQSLTDGHLALSPDGRTLAFSRRVGGGQGEICLRELSEWQIRCLPGTEDAENPFFAPDGRRVGYTVSGELRAISIDGELPIKLTDANGLGASWGHDDSVIFNRSYNEGLWRIAGPGEPAAQLTSPDSANGELGHFWPQVLADGNTVIFTVFRPQLNESEVAALRLDTGEIVPLVSGAVYGRYVATGHLLFVRSNNLMAVPFDVSRLQILGTPTPVMSDVVIVAGTGNSSLAISDDGTLAYIRESVMNPERGLVWVDRQGTRESVPGVRGPLTQLSLSPDGAKVALVVEQANPDVYTYELDGSGRGTRMTSKEGVQRFPIWTPDGGRLAFLSDEPPFDLFWLPSDRTAAMEPLRISAFDKVPNSFSPDGSMLVFTERRPAETADDLWILPLDADREPIQFLRTEFNESNGQISPDGNWIAYQSDETGRFEIYVQSFPKPAGAQRVSTDGGTIPLWSRDGRTLFYRSQGYLKSLGVDPGPPLVFSQQQRLFDLRELGDYAVGPDGRFLFVDLPAETQPRQINIVQNWFEELERLVPAE